MKQNPVIVALDIEKRKALALAKKLRGEVWGVKIGSTLFTKEGPELIKAFRKMGHQVFLDLKFHDIPHQVEGAVHSACEAGANLMTLHASGGGAMMRAASKAAKDWARTKRKPRPLVVGVTVLTSHDDASLRDIGYRKKAKALASELAELAKRSGLDGIVCSPFEARAIKKICGKKFLCVTPGIRPAGSAKGDQKRVATPAFALGEGADLLVIGRPITGAKNPAKAARDIQLSL